MSSPLRYFPVFAIVAGLGCGGGTETPSGAAGTSGNGDAVVGTFAITLDSLTPPVARILGTVKNAPVNSLTIWEQKAKDGACVVLEPRVPFCSTPCGSGNECVEDDTCKPEAKNQDVGTVEIAGIKTAAGDSKVELTLTGASTGKFGYTTATSLAYPPFDEGADVSFNVASGPFGAFSAHAKGIAPLVVPAGSLPFEKDKPLVLTWTPKGAASDSTIHVVVDISHHGGKKGEIQCDTADAGSLTIAAPLVTRLINLGVAGFPVARLTRASVGSTKISLGTVQMRAEHPIEIPLVVPGHLSCNTGDDTPCLPTGRTCQTDLQCG